MPVIKIHNQDDFDNFKENIPKELKPKKSRLNKIYEKLDNTFFKFSKRIILYLVRKEKFQKNKFKIMLDLKKISMVFFVLFVFILTPIGIVLKEEGSGLKELIGIEGLFFIAYSFLLFFEWVEFTSLQRKEAHYEPLFLLRKHPEIYQGVKMMTELEHIMRKPIRFYMIRMRIVILVPFYLFLSVLLFANQIGLEDSFILYFIFSHFLMLLNDYIDSIFDFDKPDGKKKKAKMEVSKLIQKIFENLSRATRPMPRPI